MCPGQKHKSYDAQFVYIGKRKLLIWARARTYNLHYIRGARASAHGTADGKTNSAEYVLAKNTNDMI